MIGSKEMGQLFEGLSRLDEHLGMGTTKEVFQSAGTCPWDKDKLNK